jgi:glutamine cyclotransferase
MLRAAALTACFLALVQCSPADPTTQACREPTTLRFNIAGKIVRSAIGFTQGLEFRDGKLYTANLRGAPQIVGKAERQTTLDRHNEDDAITTMDCRIV